MGGSAKGGVPMIERDVIVTTKHGGMPTFMAAPDGDERHPGIIFYMDAPGIREELRNMARRIAKHGYVCLLPDMYYRLGTVRLDMPRRDDGMSGVIRAAMNSLSIPFVNDDTAAMLAWFDANDRVKPGLVGCVGHCMSGRYHLGCGGISAPHGGSGIAVRCADRHRSGGLATPDGEQDQGRTLLCLRRT
jgi:dienelactone hydrolase